MIGWNGFVWEIRSSQNRQQQEFKTIAQEVVTMTRIKREVMGTILEGSTRLAMKKKKKPMKN